MDFSSGLLNFRSRFPFSFDPFRFHGEPTAQNGSQRDDDQQRPQAELGPSEFGLGGGHTR
jgi:hypothetical protein